jgi:hypothetical protein
MATQIISKAVKHVTYGLERSTNHYNILATHLGAQTGEVFTQLHRLNKKEVSRIELCANHCEVIFNPSLRRTALFLPYDTIESIEHYRKIDPQNVYLYRAEQLQGQTHIYYSRGEYGMTQK